MLSDSFLGVYEVETGFVESVWCIHIYIYLSLSLSLCLSICLFMSMYMYVGVYMRICTYTNSYNSLTEIERVLGEGWASIVGLVLAMVEGQLTNILLTLASSMWCLGFWLREEFATIFSVQPQRPARLCATTRGDFTQ